MSNSRHDDINNPVGGQAHADDAAAVDHLLSEIAGQKRQEPASGQGMATAAQAAVAATAGAHQADLDSLSAILSRHLQQQYLLSADAPAIDVEYSSRSAPAAGGVVGPAVAAAESDADRTESNFSEAKMFDVPGGTGGAATQRRRKVSDATSMQKLQALAEVSEERLAKQEKRMMKNRESAARSRLRRQQHTEALEEQNAALKSEVLTLRAQLALLQGRVSELEWQLQLAQAATAPATTGAAGAAAAAVSPTAAATSPAAATSAVLTSLLPSQQGNSLPLSAALGTAAAAAGAGGAAPTAAPGPRPVPASRGFAAASSPPAVADGSVSGSYAIIEALAAAMANTRNVAAGSGYDAASIDPAAAAAAPVQAGAGGGGGSTESAVAALLGLTVGSGSAVAQADQPGSSSSGSRAQQVGASSSRLAVPVSSQWQQQQQHQIGVLQATAMPAALQQQQQPPPVQQPVQQNTLPDLNHLLAAALSALTGGQTAADKPHQQQPVPSLPQQHQQQQTKGQPQETSSKLAAGQAQGSGDLSAVLAALQQQTSTSIPGAPAAVGSPETTGPTAKHPAGGNTGMSVALTQQSLAQHDTVQSGVAAILEAMQAAAAAAAAGGSANGVAEGGSAGGMGGIVAVHHTGADGERPSKRLCP